MTVALRPAALADAELVLAWRNRPEIWALGSDHRPVDAAEHARWFAETVAAARRLLLIVELGGEPIGTVRFDEIEHGTWRVSVYLVGDHPGRGFGPEALRLGSDLARARGARTVWAFVRDDNPRSVAAFRKAGYEEIADPDVEVPPAHHALRLRAGD